MEPSQTEPLQTEPLQTEPPQKEPRQTEPGQTEPPQTGPLQTEPPQTESPQTESGGGRALTRCGGAPGPLDVVLVDLPFGKRHKSKSRLPLSQLYARTAAELCRVTKPAGVVVALTTHKVWNSSSSHQLLQLFPPAPPACYPPATPLFHSSCSRASRATGARGACAGALPATA